jgi:hypothetical protein
MCYSEVVISTRFDSAEMPFGSRTVQRRSALSTCKRIVASQGGCLTAVSTITKSEPICVMLTDFPVRISRMSTWAECAP